MFLGGMLILVVSILIFAFLMSETVKPKNYPPGPTWLPIFGNYFQLKSLTKKLGGLHLATLHLAKQFDTKVLGLKLGREYLVVAFNYDLNKELMMSENFNARPNNFFIKLRCLGRERSGITCADGDVWATNRSFAVQHFRSLGFGKTHMETMVKEEVSEMLNILRTSKGDIRISNFFAPGVLNILWILTTGARLQRNDLKDILNLFQTRNKMFDITGGFLNMFPWIRFVAPNWSGYKLCAEINDKLKSIIKDTIKQHWNTWEEGREDDLIYAYISEIKKGENTVFCEEELIVICLDFFNAGTQITSGSLEMLFFMMLVHLDVQEKVKNEIDNNIDKSANLEFADATKLPYINAVILECQRFLNMTPVNGPRRSLEDYTLGGYFIPKGSTVLFNFHSIHYNQEFWNDPQEFRPQRFLNDHGDVMKSQKEYVPFGLGKRNCLGMALAKQCLFFYFVEILRHFDVKLSPGSKALTGNVSLGITLVAEKYEARFTQR